jgi:hypothetical protein
MEILRRFRRGSGEAEAAKSRATTSTEAEPETRLPPVAGPLDLETRVRRGAARTLMAIGDRLSITKKVQFDDSGFKRAKTYDYPTLPGVYELPAVEPVGSELNTPMEARMREDWPASPYGPLPLSPLPLLFAMSELRDQREEYRNTAVVEELERDRKDRAYHSDNEDSKFTHPPWSSIDLPEEPRNVVLRDMKTRYTRKLTTRDDSSASSSTGTCISN